MNQRVISDINALAKIRSQSNPCSDARAENIMNLH